MHTVFRLVLILVSAAFIVACATYSSTYVYVSSPGPEPPAAPQMELPEASAAPQVEPPTPPSPVLQPNPYLIFVKGSFKAVNDSTTYTITIGEYTYSLSGDGTWELISAP